MRLKILTVRNIHGYFYFVPSYFHLEGTVDKGLKMIDPRTDFFSSG